MIKILIVEDDPHIAKMIAAALDIVGYASDQCADGKTAVSRILHESFSLVLLDVMLPGLDGFGVMEQIRSKGVPVIFLTAMQEVSDRVRGLRSGAEDYIVKPFEVLELLARVDVVLRRYHKTSDTLDIGGLHIDQQAMQVTRDGAPIALTKKEYDLLLLFARNPGVALYRETIYERVWKEDFPYGSKTVDLHVQRLRKKVGWETKLRAVNKVGYRLEV